MTNDSSNWRERLHKIFYQYDQVGRLDEGIVIDALEAFLAKEIERAYERGVKQTTEVWEQSLTKKTK